jgi:hypothetical protein
MLTAKQTTYGRRPNVSLSWYVKTYPATRKLFAALDHDDRIAGIHQTVHDRQQMVDIRHVQAGRRLVHHIGASLLVQLAGQLDPLAFAARKLGNILKLD